MNQFCDGEHVAQLALCLHVPTDGPVPVSWIGFNTRLIPALFLQGFAAV